MNPNVIHTVYGQRYNKYDPFVSVKGELLDDGLPKRIKLSEWSSLSTAKIFADNVKNNTPPRMWKIWVE